MSHTHALDILHHVQPWHLACAFPPRRFLHGAMTTIADLPFSMAGANPVFISGKAEAVRLIVATNYLRAVGHGKGNRARRRLAALTRRAA